MYNLPVNKTPTLNIGQSVSARLTNLKSILAKELSEIDVIILKAECFEKGTQFPTFFEKPILSSARENITDTRFVTELELLTEIADLMGDLQVYAASEVAKFGIPNQPVLKLIMESNFSKLGADGLPIIDAEGKFLKGPNYWKPEAQISLMLEDRMVVATAQNNIQNAAKTIGAFDSLPTVTGV